MNAIEMDALIAVDVEASGPNPADYALLAIGACTVAEPERSFYVELQPTTRRAEPEAMAVNRLSLTRLAAEGLPPPEAMARFEDWLAEVTPAGRQPVFVAFNAPFDWMFVADYFHRYLGRNPFGYKALDIKAYYMGRHGVAWAATSHREVSGRYGVPGPLTHHAQEDAIAEADLFRQMLES